MAISQYFLNFIALQPPLVDLLDDRLDRGIGDRKVAHLVLRHHGADHGGGRRLVVAEGEADLALLDLVGEDGDGLGQLGGEGDGGLLGQLKVDDALVAKAGLDRLEGAVVEDLARIFSLTEASRPIVGSSR
jgi:hypothetical protein